MLYQVDGPGLVGRSPKYATERKETERKGWHNKIDVQDQYSALL